MDHLIDALFDDSPLSPNDVSQAVADALDEASDLSLLATLVLADDALVKPVVSALQGRDLDATAIPLWIACAMAGPSSPLDDQIDAWLAAPEHRKPTLDALVCAGLDWEHPAIAQALIDGPDRFAAASLLARAEPTAFHDIIADFKSPEAIVDALRAASLNASPDLGEALLEWRQELVDDLDERHLHHLDAALACADPNLYARHLLNGDVTSNWLADDRGVADFLSTHGLTPWTGPLAYARHVRDRQAFFLSATFAVTAAFSEPFDDVEPEELDPASASQWISQRPHQVALCLALADDDKLAELLVENALHHALLEHQLIPPAISGLPLSGPLPEPSELDDAFELFDPDAADAPQLRVALLRTLSDLLSAAWHDVLDEDLAHTYLQRYSGACDATDAMARIATNPERRVPGRPNDWGCRGLYRTQWTLSHSRRDALAALSQRLWHGPLSRADLHRQAALSLLE